MLIQKIVTDLLNLEIFYLIICNIILKMNNQQLGYDFMEADKVKKVREEKEEKEKKVKRGEKVKEEDK